MLMSGVSTCFYPRCRGAFLSSKCSLHLRCSWLSSAIKRIWKHVGTSEWSLGVWRKVQLLSSLCLTLIFNIFFASPWAPCPMFLTTPHSFLTPKCQRSVPSLRLVSISFSEPCSSLRRTVLWARSLLTLLRLHLCCLRWVRSWRPKACLSYRNVTRERLLFQNEKMKLGTVLDSVVRML